MDTTEYTGAGVNVANIERFFLARLERFARLAGEADASAIPQWRRLARHAALAAYCDCATLGLEREARAILAAATSREPLSA